MAISSSYDDFYLGQTQDLKQRISKHKRDICKLWWQHLCSFTNMSEPFFQIFLFYHVTDKYLPEFKEVEEFKELLSGNTVHSKFSLHVLFKSLNWLGIFD